MHPKNADSGQWLKTTCLNPEKSKGSDLEPFFFSRMLNEAEIKYWPTELEMAGLVWVIRKMRHLIKTTIKIIVIFTDHAANIFIMKQTIFANNNIDKLNFRLVKISIYLFQFRFNIKYRFGKKHVIPNAFSRLLCGNGPTTLPRNNLNDFLDLEIYFCGKSGLLRFF